MTEAASPSVNAPGKRKHHIRAPQKEVRCSTGTTAILCLERDFITLYRNSAEPRAFEGHELHIGELTWGGTRETRCVSAGGGSPKQPGHFAFSPGAGGGLRGDPGGPRRRPPRADTPAEVVLEAGPRALGRGPPGDGHRKGGRPPFRAVL